MTFRADASGEMVLLPEGNTDLERKALSHARWGPMTIENNGYSSILTPQDIELAGRATEY